MHLQPAGANVHRRILVTLISACVLFVVSYTWLDVRVATLIHIAASRQLSAAGAVLEEIGKSHWVLGYCALAIVLIWKTRRSAAYRHLTLFLSIAVAGLSANVLKLLFNRARPPLLFTDGSFGFRPFTFNLEFLWQSFPSGHSTTGLAIAVAGSLVWPRLRWVMWPIGLSIALGRVAYNVHYVSDVIAGGALGIVAALLVHDWSNARFQPWANNRWKVD